MLWQSSFEKQTAFFFCRCLCKWSRSGSFCFSTDISLMFLSEHLHNQTKSVGSRNLRELLFVKSKSEGFILAWEHLISAVPLRGLSQSGTERRREQSTWPLNLCIHAPFCFLAKCFLLPGPRAGAPATTRWLHCSLRRHGYFHRSSDRTQRYSDHRVPHAQAAEAAAQLRPGEHGRGRPGHGHDRGAAVCGQQRPGVLLSGQDRLRDGGLCSVLVRWVKARAQFTFTFSLSDGTSCQRGEGQHQHHVCVFNDTWHIVGRVSKKT